MSNPPAEAAMQPVWAIINTVTNDPQKNLCNSYDEAERKISRLKLQDELFSTPSRQFRISELMERAEHERQMAAKDAEIEKWKKESEGWRRNHDVATAQRNECYEKLSSAQAALATDREKLLGLWAECRDNSSETALQAQTRAAYGHVERELRAALGMGGEG